MGLGAGVHHIGAESFETSFRKVRFFDESNIIFFSHSFRLRLGRLASCASPSGAGLLASSSWDPCRSCPTVTVLEGNEQTPIPPNFATRRQDPLPQTLCGS